MFKDKNMVLGIEFEKFVLSVIQQKCIAQNKPFFSEFTMNELLQNEKIRDVELHNKLVSGVYVFDGFAPEGFDDFDMPVIIEVKYHVKNMKFTSLTKDDDKYISLYITNANLDEKEIKRRVLGKNVHVWDQHTICLWEKEYPIDFYSFYVEDLRNLEKENSLDEILNFSQKNENNKDLLGNLIDGNKISLSLGAGVSIEYGTKGWDNLIKEFYNEIEKDGKADNTTAIQRKIGGTNLINGQFTQDNLKDFMKSLYSGLYSKFKPPVKQISETTLKYVALIISQLKSEKKFNVITYNYDNFLEQELNDLGCKYNVIYNEQIVSNDELNIYHPHGYLPFGILAKQYSQYKDYIVFSESEYHKLYNNAYHWSVVLQHYLYRDNTYLFVGCSLTDPNLRRILETTQITGKTHIALMLTESLSVKDQFIVHRHFARIGVECIWFESEKELKEYLDLLSMRTLVS